MYGVGKILQLDGRNASIESSLIFPESDSGLFIVEVVHAFCKPQLCAYKMCLKLNNGALSVHLQYNL